MKKLLFVLCLGMAAYIVSCSGDSSKQSDNSSAIDPQLEKEAMEIAKGTLGYLPSEAPNPDNPATDEKIFLGKVLYFDKRLSKDGNISCNSCHQLDKFGVDNLAFSPGDDGTLGGRNSPTSLNAAFHFAQFWDGRAKDVEEQAGMPILNPVEHAIPSEDFLMKRIAEIKTYQTLFKNAYPDDKNPITFNNLKKAIGSFERTLITPSRFDQFAQGDANALNLQEKRGIKEFINAGCGACHNGPLLGGKMFQKFGVFADYWTLTGSKNIDKGRFDVTNQESDMYMFKVPSLRNIEHTFPYFHDGSVEKLEDAVKIMVKLQQNRELSDNQVNDIVAFLKTLSGELPIETKLPPPMEYLQ
jgi:cytochrome c peroxidase